MITAAFIPASGILTARGLRRPGRPIFRLTARHVRRYPATRFNIGRRSVRDPAPGHALSFAGYGDAR